MPGYKPVSAVDLLMNARFEECLPHGMRTTNAEPINADLPGLIKS